MGRDAMRIKTLAFGLCVIISGVAGLLPRSWAAPSATTKVAVPHASNPFAGMPVLANTQLDSAPSDPASVAGRNEEIRVLGHRMPRPMPVKPLIPQHQFADGHTEAYVPLWPGKTVLVRFGEDMDHDPVTGTGTSRFGEAYSETSPLRPR